MTNELYPTPLRLPGYLVAVSAPNSGISAMRDGSWHVIAEVDSFGQSQARTTAQGMIPFVLGTGGDLVMYRMDEDNTVILRKGGKSGAAPAVEDLVPYDPNLALKLEETRKSFVLSSKRKPAPAPASWKPDAWMALTGGAIIAIMLLAVGYWHFFGASDPRQGDGSRSYAYDPNDVRMEAMRRGAYQMSTPDPDNAKKTIVVRYYPKDDGTFARQIVDRYWTSTYEGSDRPPPEPEIPWTRR